MVIRPHLRADRINKKQFSFVLPKHPDIRFHIAACRELLLYSWVN